jgi:hypothetical protein
VCPARGFGKLLGIGNRLDECFASPLAVVEQLHIETATDGGFAGHLTDPRPPSRVVTGPLDLWDLIG